MTAPRKTGKTGSRNPANKPTSAAAWKKSALPPLLEMPSGNYMRIKKIGLQALVAKGIVPNSLLGIAEKAVAKGQQKQGPSDADLAGLVQDKEQVAAIGKFMDEVVILCAAEPTVEPLPPEGVERDDELLYIDEVGDEDKMFVFQVVTGGTTDVEQFRNETGATMAAIRGREDVELPAE